MFSQEIKQEADLIDYQITMAVLHAEKQMSQRQFGYGWSPELASAGKAVTLWKNCLKQYKAGQDPFTYFSTSKRHTYGLIQCTSTLTIRQCQQIDRSA